MSYRKLDIPQKVKGEGWLKEIAPAYFIGHTFYSKLVIPGLNGGQKWEFKLSVQGFKNGKYICKIEEYVFEPNRGGPSRQAKSMVGKKLKLWEKRNYSGHR